MQATQGSSVVWQGSQAAIMSHLKPFSPAMACERQPLSKLPLEARTMIEAYCGSPTPTPTAAIVNSLRKYHYFLMQWRLDRLTLKLGKDLGFQKYLRLNFDPPMIYFIITPMPGRPHGQFRRVYTHKLLGHSFEIDGYDDRVVALSDASGVLCSYPGFDLPVESSERA